MRNYLTALAVGVSLMLSASAQLLLRNGMVVLSQHPSAGTVGGVAVNVARSPWVWAGLFCYGASMGPWLFVLSRLPVSVAYPMVSVGYVFTAGLAWLLLNETITPMRAAGIALICAGVAVISRST